MRSALTDCISPPTVANAALPRPTVRSETSGSKPPEPRQQLSNQGALKHSNAAKTGKDPGLHTWQPGCQTKSLSLKGDLQRLKGFILVLSSNNKETMECQVHQNDLAGYFKILFLGMEIYSLFVYRSGNHTTTPAGRLACPSH